MNGVMSATILLSVMAASLAIPQSSSSFDGAALAMRDSDGVAVVRLFVAPDRTVEDCKMLSREVSQADSERVCGKLVGRRAAAPAFGPDGQAAYGTLTYVVAEVGNLRKTGIEGNLPADMVLDVKSLPGGLKSKAIGLNLLLDPAGKVSHCEASDGAGDGFSHAACAALANEVLEVRKDPAGNPVAYVDRMTVAFVSKS